ncbi:MAG: hypothetical protein ABL998_13490 [Planctomycetota bacterium]
MPLGVVSYLVQASAPEAERLSPSGIALMTFSICSVLTLVTWCYRRILTAPPVANERDGDSAG